MSSEEQVAFRPRYSADESSNEAYAEDLRQQRFKGRKRRLCAVIILIIGFLSVTIIFRIYNFISGGLIGRAGAGSSKENALAIKESFGLFANIPNTTWKQKKAASKKAVKLQSKMISKTSNMLSESGANIDESRWWAQNWRPNFSCDSKMLIGGKWICAPSRIIDLADEHKNVIGRKKKKQRGRKECLIYVSGGNDFEFGHQFLTFSEARMTELHKDEPAAELSICEIHIFNHYIDPTLLASAATHQANGIHIHPFGFRPENKESMGVAGGSVAAFKTLKETVKELGHTGKSLSIFSIDCEGCEWDIYKELLSSDLDVQQVLIQMHGTPFTANRFFAAMHNAGYAIFHRQEVDVSVYDYAFLKLAPSYFGSTKPNLNY